jgi:hypothetical protein
MKLSLKENKKIMELSLKENKKNNKESDKIK